MATPEPGRPAPRRFWIAWVCDPKVRCIGKSVGVLALTGMLIFWGPTAVYYLADVGAKWYQLIFEHSSVAAGQVAITVQSPSVQTRERLINDRFEQVAWTDKLLEHTMGIMPPTNWDPPAVSGTDARLGDTKPNADVTGNETPSRDTRPKERGKSRSNIQISGKYDRQKQVVEYGEQQKSWFQAMRGFRDLLRNERADAMLDDRHDMDGNTLYNLSFDTTILPNLNREGYAAIKVLLTDDPDDLQDKVSGDGVRRQDEYTASELNGYTAAALRARSLKRRDIYEIYLDWQVRLQKLLDVSLDARSDEIDGSFLIERNFIDLEKQYWIGICSSLVHIRAADQADLDDVSKIRKACVTGANDKPVDKETPARIAHALVDIKKILKEYMNSTGTEFRREIQEEYAKRYARYVSGAKEAIIRQLEKLLTIVAHKLESRMDPKNPFPASKNILKEIETLKSQVDEFRKNKNIGDGSSQFVPGYGRAVETCATQTQTRNKRFFPPLADIANNYIRLVEDGRPPAGQMPLAGTTPGVPNQQSPSGTAEPAPFSDFLLQCPPVFGQLEVLWSLESIHRLLEMVDSNPANNGSNEPWKKLTKIKLSRTTEQSPEVTPGISGVRRVQEMFEPVKLQLQRDGAESSKLILEDLEATSASCIAAAAVYDQLTLGHAHVIPGRGGARYDKFFKVIIDRDPKGHCHLTLHPKIESLIGHNIDPGDRAIRTKKDGSFAPVECSPDETEIGEISSPPDSERKRLSEEIKDACFAPEGLKARCLAVEKTRAFDERGPLVKQDGYAPARIGQGFYPIVASSHCSVRAVSGQPALSPGSKDERSATAGNGTELIHLLRIGRRLQARDSDANDIVFDNEADVLGRLEIQLEGPTFSDDAAIPMTEAYAYGLTPRLWRNFSVNLREEASTKGTSPYVSAQAGSSSNLSAGVSEASVVGFNPFSSQLGSKRAAEFGWIVAPQTSSGNSRQVPVAEMALGALVAVPSWWRTALLRICVTGVDEHKLAALSSPSLWPLSKCRVETLRLPGTATDISRRLGFEVLTTPQVTSSLTFTLEAYRPASLLLIGDRLWRSTVVTLGGLRADRISVLPDMGGIVADFACVRPANTAFGEPNRVEVRVWTSEGAVPGPTALISPPGASSDTSCPNDGTPDRIKKTFSIPTTITVTGSMTTTDRVRQTFSGPDAEQQKAGEEPLPSRPK